MPALITLIATILFLDFYSHRGLLNVLSALQIKTSGLFTYFHWSVSVLAIISILIVAFYRKNITSPSIFPNLYYSTGFIAVIYLPKLFFSLFLLVQDFIHLIKWFIQLITNSKVPLLEPLINGQWIGGAGVLTASVMLFIMIHGVYKGRFSFTAKKEIVTSHKIPKQFDGFKVLQFSDMHIGSFWGHEEQIDKAVEEMNKLKPDIIVFTGDMVNHQAAELKPFIDKFQKASALFGKYSVLGNHDYGSYAQWETKGDEKQNLIDLKSYEKEAGFQLLLNETVQIEKDGEFIQLTGVENWGKPPFPQFGNLDKALENTDTSCFTILLSHDPSHWEEKVIDKTAIDLTLSGHTHGMQIGFNTKTFKWSPVKFKYPQWNGMYKHNDQLLYVNIGLGFIAFPFRTGMAPELTLFELQSTRK